MKNCSLGVKQSLVHSLTTKTFNTHGHLEIYVLFVCLLDDV